METESWDGREKNQCYGLMSARTAQRTAEFAGWFNSARRGWTHQQTRYKGSQSCSPIPAVIWCGFIPVPSGEEMVEEEQVPQWIMFQNLSVGISDVILTAIWQYRFLIRRLFKSVRLDHRARRIKIGFVCVFPLMLDDTNVLLALVQSW